MLKNSVKRLLLFYILNSAFLITQAQVNLVPNPSFEIHDTCPDGYSQITRAKDWKAPTTGTPDYYHQCCPNGPLYVGVPLNYMGNQNAVEGNGYAAVFAYDSYGQIPGQSFREYIQTQLTSSLIAGTKYYLVFYASLADSCKYAVDDLGVYLSVAQISRNDYDTLGFLPQVENLQGNYLSNKMLWYKVAGSFIAGGGEQYLTIGNFKSDNNTDTIKISTYQGTNQDYTSAYYYIDAVCLSTDSLFCNSQIGINSLHNANEIKLTNDANYIYLHDIKDKIKIKIFTTSGNKILEKAVFVEDPALDIRDWKSGVYLIHIFIDNSLYIKKLCLIKNP